MANQHSETKQEPPWLPLHPMPRISVSSFDTRARLSHRRTILLPASPNSAISSSAGNLEAPCPVAPPMISLSVEAPPSVPRILSSPVSQSFNEDGGVPGKSLESCPVSAHDLSGSLDCSDGNSATAVTSPSNPTPSDDFLGKDVLPSVNVNVSADLSHSVSHSVLISEAPGSFPTEPFSLPPLPTQGTLMRCEDDRSIPGKGVGMEIISLEKLDEDWVPNSSGPGNDLIASSDREISPADVVSSFPSERKVEQAESCVEVRVSLKQESCSMSHGAEVSEGVTKDVLSSEEVELEEGQLPGEWSGNEESFELLHSRLDPQSESHGNLLPVLDGAHRKIERRDFSNEFHVSSDIMEIYSEQMRQGNNKARGKKQKNKKHKKGEGSKKRARQKSKDKYNEVLKKRKTGGKDGADSTNVCGAKSEKGAMELEELTAGRSSLVKCKVSESGSQTQVNKPAADEEPEDGEILFESTKTNNGILSALVEAEVGLWTTDDVDDQFVAQMEEDGAVKKKRGPETAERKLKKKIAKCRKRNQKARELGIRRPLRTLQSKPVKVLCTHYMKGRCAKGENCTFSHDAVPLTKQEPCKFLMINSCLKGDDCPYSHDLRAFPCKFFHTKGFCYDGADCQFSHETISEGALEKLQQRVEKEKKDRSGSATNFDIPVPLFSTPLPPELDPDPLGWGTPTSYLTHEGMLSANSRAWNRSMLLNSDFNLVIHPTGSPSVGLNPGQSAPILPSASGMGSEFDAVMPCLSEAVKNYQGVLLDDETTALGSDSTTDFKSFKREEEKRILSNPSLLEGPHMLTNNASNPPVSQSPNAMTNARTGLDISSMDKEIQAEKSIQEPVRTETPCQSEQQVILSPLCSLESPVPARSLTESVLAVVRGRQLGNRVLEPDIAILGPPLATAKRLHTVKSLLDEALRH